MPAVLFIILFCLIAGFTVYREWTDSFNGGWLFAREIAIEALQFGFWCALVLTIAILGIVDCLVFILGLVSGR